MKPELFWLTLTAIATGLMFLPYILDRIAVRGLMGTMANPGPADAPQHAWAQRAQRAHANAVENLVVFVALVAAAQFAGISSAQTALGCQIYFWARLAHYVIYSAGIPVLRTLAFAVALVGEALIALALLQAM